MLRDTTSRGLYVRVWPPHTSERRGGGGGAIKVYIAYLESSEILRSWSSRKKIRCEIESINNKRKHTRNISDHAMLNIFFSTC